MIDTLSVIILTVVTLLTAWGARRDLRIPLWTTLSAFAVALSLSIHAIGPAFASLGVLILICLMIIETDRRHHLIPDTFTIALFALALVMPFDDDLQAQTLGAVVLGALFLATRYAFAARGSAEALGLGDVKLAAAIGAVLGPVHAFYAVFIAGLATILVVAVRNRGGVVSVGAPFGVGLAAATAAIAVLRALTL
ncbi:A24 family peptidase [Vitreimonas flagellata]|uniref:prepilin peptidase n=1 Tax=Vitreimonas flagellata TaxID=2560861 RepID=UPI00107566AB|nr:A24 family peptidase [Vitreimonas flagellata]